MSLMKIFIKNNLKLYFFLKIFNNKIKVIKCKIYNNNNNLHLVNHKNSCNNNKYNCKSSNKI